MERTVVFTINGEPIETVEEFKYLGRIVTREDDDEAAVKGNLAKAKKKWASMQRFLITDGVDSKTMAIFYRTVAGDVCAAVRKRNMGADERYDEAASQFSQEMLSGDNRRIYSSGRGWRMDLPRQQ
jgi:hypothetical protein